MGRSFGRSICSRSLVATFVSRRGSVSLTPPLLSPFQSSHPPGPCFVWFGLFVVSTVAYRSR